MRSWFYRLVTAALLLGGQIDLRGGAAVVGDANTSPYESLTAVDLRQRSRPLDAAAKTTEGRAGNKRAIAAIGAV